MILSLGAYTMDAAWLLIAAVSFWRWQRNRSLGSSAMFIGALGAAAGVTIWLLEDINALRSILYNSGSNLVLRTMMYTEEVAMLLHGLGTLLFAFGLLLSFRHSTPPKNT